MSLSLTTLETDWLPADPEADLGRSAPGEQPHRGWAVVEVYSDGSLGRPQLVTARGPVEATTALPHPAPDLEQVGELSTVVGAHLGTLHATQGRLREAARAFALGEGLAPSLARDNYLGRLALIEAYQGELRRAAGHADQVLDATRPFLDIGTVHAQVARAWVHLQRLDLAEARRRLDLVQGSIEPAEEPWLATSHLLVEVGLLMATHQPDSATRLLAGSPLSPRAHTSDWLSDLVATARADALLAAGEPQRALAVVTPLPVRTAAEATVVAAASRLGIGDVRGAHAVLSTAVHDLECAPLGVQVRAWLLEARLTEDRGHRERARLVVDRALQCASAEGLRSPLAGDWRWLRALVEQDPTLMRSHRDYLQTFPTDDASSAERRHSPSGAEQLRGAALTEREGQVLDLLAQMYSTDEIAAALYVSANTVKTHLKGIFGKLCVNRRVDAVRRGRQLGLC